MALNTKNILSNGEFKGVLFGYDIKKETVKASYTQTVKVGEEMEAVFTQGEDVIKYKGYISILTNPETGQFVTVNINTNAPMKFQDHVLEVWGAKKIKRHADILEMMVDKKLDTYNKIKDITKVHTVTVQNNGLTDKFYPMNGEIVENINVELGFGNLFLDEPTEEPKFENSVIVHGMVKDVRPEVDKEGEETGRALVDVYVPYISGSEKKGNQVIRAYKTTFVAGFLEGETEEEDYDLGADLLDYADEIIEDSWKFGIEINNYYVEKEAPKAETEGGKRFGRQVRETVQTNRERKSEFLLTGIDQLMTPFDEEDIRDALKMREVAIEEAKKRAEERQANTTTSTAKPSRGITRGRTESTGETTAPSRAGGRTRERRFG